MLKNKAVENKSTENRSLNIALSPFYLHEQRLDDSFRSSRSISRELRELGPYGSDRSHQTGVHREGLNKPVLAGKIKNTLSKCKQHLPALIPGDVTLQVQICSCFGLWPWSGRGAQHKVNETQNTVRPDGGQTQGRRVPTCQLHPWTVRVRGPMKIMSKKMMKQS